VQGLNDHYRVLEWEEFCWEPQVERLVAVYQKTALLGLQTFPWNKFAICASNVNCMEKIWKNFQETLYKSLEHFVPHKLLRKNLDSEYYYKEVKRSKLKVGKACNRRKIGERHLEEMKRVSKRLLASKITAQDTFLDQC
jgi:hypothetical protein